MHCHAMVLLHCGMSDQRQRAVTHLLVVLGVLGQDRLHDLVVLLCEVERRVLRVVGVRQAVLQGGTRTHKSVK